MRLALPALPALCLVAMLALAGATAADVGRPVATVAAAPPLEAVGHDPGGNGSTPAPETPVCAGRMTSPANGLTVVSIQGSRIVDGDSRKTPARVVAFGPGGRIQWVHHSGRDLGVAWSYDVDPLPNGNVFVTATRPGTTLLYELNATTGERVWSDELPFLDTHDADPLNRTHVVVANMRNANASSGTNDDRVVVYDRQSDEVVWEWRFADHYDRSVGGNFSEDWTHVNDVDAVTLGDADRPTHFLLSPRNFDQVVLVNRSTGAIDVRLGADGDRRTLFEQHNPDFLLSNDGTPTLLVGDSENDRIVEYAERGDDWTRTWRVGSAETLDWPRDADRLHNGHTLIGDSRNHRVLEVTPRGEVVWEVYAPWLVYDVERIPARGFAADGYRDVGGSRGPTMADIGGTGGYALSNATPPEAEALERCDAAVTAHEGGFGPLWNESVGTATPAPTDGQGAAGTEGTGADGEGTDGRTGTATMVPTTATETAVPGFGLVLALVALAAFVAVRGRSGS